MDPASLRPSAIPGHEDWPAYVRRHPIAQLQPAAGPLAAALGVPELPPPSHVTVQWEDTHDGVTTSQLGWQLGFGPRTRAWLVKPAATSGPLPGVLALHCHGGKKDTGASRLITFPPGRAEPNADIDPDRHGLYGGRALATELARDGFAVLAHDTFSWGSRRFNLDAPPWRTAAGLAGQFAAWREDKVTPTPAQAYNAAAAFHEDTVAKAAGLLGTSLAGMVAHDDLAALDVLASLPGVDPGRIGAVGFSGGGGRALILAALSPLVRSYVVTAMMTTLESLLPAHVDAHSWLLQTPGLGRLGEWPQLAALSAAALLVQYALADPLFPEQGMRDAHALLSAAQCAGSYEGSWWPGGHEFTPDMQREAFEFLAGTLQIGTVPPSLAAAARSR